MGGNSCWTGMPPIIGIILMMAAYICTTKGCDSGEWKCGSGECIQIKYLCNKHYECRDQTDEDSHLCQPNKSTEKQEKHGCPDGQFQCANKQCYYIDWQCDGTADCEDGTDEKGCPDYTNHLMPKTSIIGMSVAVSGLFFILIAVIIFISCARRKNGPSFPFRNRHRDINEVVYSGDNVTNGPIACPTISGEIVMREPPPRYTSQPDLYMPQPHAAINLAFTPDNTTVSRPPPCYTSQPNLLRNPSILSICSSVEAPPSYTSYQDANIMDANITEGTINLSFCPDDDVMITGHNLRGSSAGLNTTVNSIHSVRSWADNLDAEVFNLENNRDEPSVRNIQNNEGPNRETIVPNVEQYRETSVPHRQPIHVAASTSSLNQPSNVHSSSNHVQISQNCVPKPKTFKKQQHQSSKTLSRALRAKALGREFSSTPALSFEKTNNLLIQQNKGSKQNIYRRKSNELPDHKETLPYDCQKQRKVKSVATLNEKQKSVVHEEKIPERANSIACCDSYPNSPNLPLNGKGIQFWRNQTLSLSKASIHTDYNEQIPYGNNIQEYEYINQDKRSTVQAYPNAISPAVPSETFAPSLSHTLNLRKDSIGSNSSVNSWMC